MISISSDELYQTRLEKFKQTKYLVPTKVWMAQTTYPLNFKLVTDEQQPTKDTFESFHDTRKYWAYFYLPTSGPDTKRSSAR